MNPCLSWRYAKKTWSMWQCCAPTTLYDIGCRSTQGAMGLGAFLGRCPWSSRHCDIQKYLAGLAAAQFKQTAEARDPCSLSRFVDTVWELVKLPCLDLEADNRSKVVRENMQKSGWTRVQSMVTLSSSHPISWRVLIPKCCFCT